MQKTLSSNLALFLAAATIAVGALLVGPLAASAHDNGERAHKLGAHAVGSTLEVRINDDNSVVVRGAKVTAVSGSVITAQTAFGSTMLSWSVQTNADTRFANRADSSASLATIAVGDYISFSGSLNTAVTGLTVNAKAVKDWSKAAVETPRSAFAGTVQSVDAANLKFTLATGGAEGVITVKMASTSAIISGQGSLAFSNILVGDKAVVKGTYDSALKVFTASKVSIERKNAEGRRIFHGAFKALQDRFQLHLSFRK